MTGSLTERYDDRIAGVLSCYDRVVVTGTLPTVCYAAGMTKFLYAIGVRIFDYPQFASTLRDRVRERAASLAAEAGITIEHIAKSYIRKEAVVAEVLKRKTICAQGRSMDMRRELGDVAGTQPRSPPAFLEGSAPPPAALGFSELFPTFLQGWASLSEKAVYSWLDDRAPTMGAAIAFYTYFPLRRCS